jgi:hypothetical protein
MLATSWVSCQSFLSSKLGLKLNESKSRITTAREGFDFVGFHFLRRFERRKGSEVTRFFPSRGAVSKFRNRVRELTGGRTAAHIKDEKQLAKELNMCVRPSLDGTTIKSQSYVIYA